MEDDERREEDENNSFGNDVGESGKERNYISKSIHLLMRYTLL